MLTSRMIDRPLRPLFPEGLRLRDAGDRRCCSSADLENDSRRAGDHRAPRRRSTSPTSRSRPRSRAVRVGFWDGAVRRSTRPSPDLKAKSRLNLLVAGTEDAIVMVESGAQELTEAEMVRALSEGHEAIKQIVAAAEGPARAGRQAEARGQAKEQDHGLRGAGPSRCLQAPLLAAMRTPGKLESVREDEAGEGRVPGEPARETATEKRAAVPGDLRRRCARRSCASEILEQRPPSRRPQLRRDPQHHQRGRRAAAHPRLGALHARRDAGARHGHARHQRGRADHRHRAGGATPRSASCCTTTSRPSRSAR